MTACQSCAARQGAKGGRYDMACLECCAMFVLSAHPSTDLARSHLDTIGHFKAAPPRAEIVRRVREMLTETGDGAAS